MLGAALVGRLPGAEAQIYRWTDERGGEHFVSSPARVPPGRAYEVIGAPQAGRDADHEQAVAAERERLEARRRERAEALEEFEHDLEIERAQQAALEESWRARKADWERDLKLAKSTKFKDADTSKVSIGAVVGLENVADGAAKEFTVLGAWDSDPEKGIIAYLSDVGQALLEKGVGEEVVLPTAEGDRETFRITGISAWVTT